MGPRSPEGKAAKAIITALDKAEIDESAIAYMLSNASNIIHKRLWKIFMWLIKFWAMDYDAGEHLDDDLTNLVVGARRVHEVLARYRHI